RAAAPPLLPPADGVPHRFQTLDEVGGPEAPARSRHVARPVRVADPEVDGIEASGVRQLVHLRLDREGDLRVAVAAELAAGMLVRVDERGANVHAPTGSVP